jgi:hypothetical protein
MEIPTFKSAHIIYFLDKLSYSREQKYYFIYFVSLVFCSLLKSAAVCIVYL